MTNLLFRPWKIKDLQLKNRTVLSAAADNLDNDLLRKIDRFKKLAQGEIGLIIASGSGSVAKLRDVVAAVHDNGGKIAIQLVAKSGFYKDGLAVSELPKDHIFFANPFFKYVAHREFTVQEIVAEIAEYTNAAKIAQEIGADAIQIHSAHHSLPSQFLSPLTNQRNDEWGGSVENRIRFHLEIAKAIKAVTQIPLLIKLGLQDELPGGLTLKEGLKIGALLAPYFDAIEVSQGLQDLTEWNKTPMHNHVRNAAEEAYYRNWSRELKKIITKPVILTGGNRSLDLSNEILAQQEADAIGFCRPFIREPNLIKRWLSGDEQRATCISCNKCITELLIKGLGLECYLDIKKSKF